MMEPPPVGWRNKPGTDCPGDRTGRLGPNGDGGIAVIWVLLLLTAGALAAWLVWPRRLQTLRNVPAVVDKRFQAHGIVETTEDPREVRPMAQAAAKVTSDIPVKGHGDSLTMDWPSERHEPHERSVRQALQGQEADGRMPDQAPPVGPGPNVGPVPSRQVPQQDFYQGHPDE